MIRRLSMLLTAVAFGLAGCGTNAVDYPLAQQQQNTDRRSIDTIADGTFVILAFSGGGSRAAALAASVTAELDGITYQSRNGPRKLSEDIAVVSSVSGGSVYATYLALNGPSKEMARVFEDKLQDFDGFGYLAGRLLNPVTWISLQLENTTRVNILQDMINEFLGTKDKTLSVLNQPRRPVVLLNASDMVAGHVFTFDPNSLDDLCMHFDSTPLSLATTASADFPGAFTPVLLRNDSYLSPGGCPGKQIPPGDWRTQLRDPGGPYANLETFRYARYRDSLRAGQDSFRRPQYVRLVDGGVIDNLGLTSIRMGLLDFTSPFNLNRLVDAKLKNLVVIVVNARRDAPSDLDASTKYTSIPTILENVSGVLVDSASEGAAATFRAFIVNLAAERNKLAEAKLPGSRFDIYPVDIDFDQLPYSTPAERKIANDVKAISTNWTLKQGDVKLIDMVAKQLLWRHPCFRGLVTSLQAPLNPDVPMVPAACTAPPLPPL